jgi:hypothetical protein
MCIQTFVLLFIIYFRTDWIRDSNQLFVCEMIMLLDYRMEYLATNIKKNYGVINVYHIDINK